ncbi:glycosyltransferase family 2 protein [uncultured Piscinibacter sp.]|uniref:glycosyltransferase family 2 protein n=1 Tax=uncultured Piscinibacter sp. TaxID=1131835 RepID=UPI0026163C24|nr:glycosyltransferase family 2 protein [uncultured Piscinibacter sp.]
MIHLLQALLFALALPTAAASLYLLAFTLLSQQPPPGPRSSRRMKFDIVVPAHDEAAVIGAVVASLKRLDWPEDGYRVLVVADNCSDDTAALARAAGAVVLERHDAERRGKGHALEFGFAASRRDARAYAVVVVDADTEISPNLLEAFAGRIEAGAKAVQAHYGVLNAQASWRTRLMAIALSCFHRVRSRGRERLGLSCGLRGNGWCVTHRLLREVPYRAYSLAEDIEYGIDLALAGHRIHHADEARVDALMVSGGAAAATQRQRWEDGRRQLIRTRLGPLLRCTGRPDGAVCLDLALDLLMPPLAWVLLGVVALLAMSGLAWPWVPGAGLWMGIALACAASLLLHVLRGWQLSGVGLRGLLDLARVPGFVLWKLLLMLRTHDVTQWIRTRREEP